MKTLLSSRPGLSSFCETEPAPGRELLFRKMRRLLAARRPDHTLPRELYTDADVLDFDIEAIFHRHWIQAGLEVEIPNAGDYFTIAIGPSSVIIARNKEGGVSASFNSCRHRGAKICPEGRGNVPRLICPYHNWVYDLEGKLVRAPRMQKDFNPAAHNLGRVHVEILAGVIYICLAENAPDFQAFRMGIEPLLEPHDLKNAKVAHTAELVEKANWKLVMENARECYHCPSGHPELMNTLRLSTTGVFGEPEPWLEEFWKRCEAKGLKNGPVSGTWFEAGRYPLQEGAVSFTMDGQPAVSKVCGRMGDGDVGSMRWALQPNVFNHAAGDYVFMFEAYPTGPQETVVRAKWLVNKDAVEGVDYQLDRLIEVWNATNFQDRALSENNQQGVNSLGYIPGPYSKVTEGRVLELIDWYCAAASEFLAGQVEKNPE